MLLYQILACTYTWKNIKFKFKISITLNLSSDVVGDFNDETIPHNDEIFHIDYY